MFSPILPFKHSGNECKYIDQKEEILLISVESRSDGHLGGQKPSVYKLLISLLSVYLRIA